MRFTVFTPLYNRSNYLDRIYESLKKQSFKDFEWVIVDDGSNDDPEKIINNYIEEDTLKIVFFEQKNKGKHFAINKGLEFAEGEYFYIVDSDDFLPDDALLVLNQKISTISDKSGFAGVAGRTMNHDRIILGTQFEQDISCSSIDIRYRYKITGDLAEVFKTEILKKYKFPEISGEKFCPEALVWNRIAENHKLLFFNLPIYICEYLPGGLSDKIVKIRMDSPQATMLTYSELYKHNIPLISKIKSLINFWRFSFNSEMSFNKKLKQVPNWSTIFIPLCYLIYLKDKSNYKS